MVPVLIRKAFNSSSVVGYGWLALGALRLVRRETWIFPRACCQAAGRQSPASPGRIEPLVSIYWEEVGFIP